MTRIDKSSIPSIFFHPNSLPKETIQEKQTRKSMPKVTDNHIIN